MSSLVVGEFIGLLLVIIAVNSCSTTVSQHWTATPFRRVAYRAVSVHRTCCVRRLSV